jgi:hypothetical protein
MSFWDDRLGPAKKAQPVTPQTVAPGGWWQTPTQQQQAQRPVETVGQVQQQQDTGEYAPRSSGFVKTRTQNDVSDQCPRCNSYDYIKIAAEPASGSVYTLPGSSSRCMACNYPGLDTSEGVIGGPGGFIPTGGSVSAATLKVRERGGRNTNSFAGFNESSQAADSHVVRIM